VRGRRPAAGTGDTRYCSFMRASRKHPWLKTAVREAVKWRGAGLTVFLVVVWIGSGFKQTHWSVGSDGHLALAKGGLFIAGPLFEGSRGSGRYLWFEHNGYELRWWFEWWHADLPSYGNETDWYFTIPLWLPALLSLSATAAAWRADCKSLRRARAGLCAGCGYDRSGLAFGAVCPECGKPVTSAAHAGHAAAEESPVRS